jgi:glutamate-1-semialdehyde 2,1-aminomutase
LDLHGSHKVFGFEPDLICFCKAIANGHALSATLGRKELRVAASEVFLTGSYWNSAPTMAASMKCLEVMQREDTPAILRGCGESFMSGLIDVAKKHGYAMSASGPPALPFPTFDSDPDLRRQQRFCGEVTRRGARARQFHPEDRSRDAGAAR